MSDTQEFHYDFGTICYSCSCATVYFSRHLLPAPFSDVYLLFRKRGRVAETQGEEMRGGRGCHRRDFDLF